MSSSINTTIFIPVLQSGPEEVTKTMKSLLLQGYGHFQVIWLISSRNNQTLQAIQRLVSRHSAQTRTAKSPVMEVVARDFRTEAQALNYGVMTTPTENLLFTLPGAILPPCWTAVMSQSLKSFDAVNGSFINKELFINSKIAIQLQSILYAFLSTEDHCLSPINLGNFGIRRRALVRAGLFHKHIPYVCGPDLSLRLCQNDIPIQPLHSEKKWPPPVVCRKGLLKTALFKHAWQQGYGLMLMIMYHYIPYHPGVYPAEYLNREASRLITMHETHTPKSRSPLTRMIRKKCKQRFFQGVQAGQNEAGSYLNELTTAYY